MFVDYFSTFDDFKKKTKESGVDYHDAMKTLNLSSVSELYDRELKYAVNGSAKMAIARLIAEKHWYEIKRPFFNVYPSIEKKLLALNGQLLLSEISLPFGSIEVRTKGKTMLFSDTGSHFIIVVELGNGNYQELVASKQGAIGDFPEKEFGKIEDPELPGVRKSGIEVSRAEIGELFTLCCGVCMLANDKSIVTPIVLSSDKQKTASLNDITKYAEKCIRRTGRVGFEVGKSIESMAETMHYRTSHFAKYYVAKNHASYPANATTDKAAVLIWRSGTIVNRTKIPTGYKDSQCSTTP